MNETKINDPVKELNSSVLKRLKEEKNIKLKGGLYHYMQVKFAYNSNKIEGGTLSEDETRFIFETDTINAHENKVYKVNDIVEIKNHFKCFDYVIETADKTLSEDIIKEYHRLLKSGTSDSANEWFKVGDYKGVDNTVANIATTPVSEVENEMKKLITLYTGKEKIVISDIVDFHYRFERIHPFQDGNGRVGRLIMYKECLKNNIVPFVIHDENKRYYYDGLSRYRNEPKHLNEICLLEQDKCAAIMDYFKIKYERKNEINNKIIPNNRQITEQFFTDIGNKREEMESQDEKTKNSCFFKGYFGEIKKAEDNLYNFMTNGEIDKNYIDAVTELKAVCKMDIMKLKGKDDLEDKGKLRALLDLEIGCDNALRVMSSKRQRVLFTGINIDKDIPPTGGRRKK
jgi:Fic family protein